MRRGVCRCSAALSAGLRDHTGLRHEAGRDAYTFHSSASRPASQHPKELEKPLSRLLPIADTTTGIPIQPRAAELADINARLSTWFADALDQLARFRPIDDSAETDPDTALSRTQLLSLAIGFVGCDTAEQRDHRTYTLVYTDPAQTKSNYQTICIPDYAAASPIEFTRRSGTNRGVLTLRRSDEVLAEVLVHARIFEASGHYYSRVSPAFDELPTAAIVSPYSTCAGGCLGCSRGAISSFTSPPRNYIQHHVAELAADYDRRGWDRDELISVNITTGCQPSEERELDMMLALIAEYRRQGFRNAAFHVFTYAIDSQAAMDRLLKAGAIGFIGTVECINDTERLRQWGKKKGAITFAQHVDKYRRARRAGFEIVETDYVLGADSHSEMLDGIHELDANSVAVVPNIKRNYTSQQLDTNHPDIWRNGLTYIADGFHAALATYRHGTIKRRAARLTLDYLQRQDWRDLTLRDLPIRHT